MELAFTAFLIFLLALPGILYRAAYQSGWDRRKIPNPSPPAIEQVGRSFGAALLAHTLWYLASEWIFLPFLSVFWPQLRDTDIHLESVPLLLLGQYGENSAKLQEVLNSFLLPPYPQLVLLYFGSLCAAAWLLGLWLYALVRRRHLDYTVPRLRFDNEWFYRFYPFPSQVPLDDDSGNQFYFGATFVSAVVTLGGGDYIYRGAVKDYNFAPDGTLYSLELIEAERRPLTQSSDDDGEFYSIDGDFLVLCLSDIKTLNIKYVFEPVTSDENAP